MATPGADDLDGLSESVKYPDGTVVRVFCRRTDRDAYPSGWAYKFHYGAAVPDPPRTLDDGTIRRYDNSHERTKGHELHAAPDPDPEPEVIDFRDSSNSGIGSGARFRNQNSRSIGTIETVIP